MSCDFLKVQNIFDKISANLKDVTGYVRQYTGRTFPFTCLSPALIVFTKTLKEILSA